MATYVMLSTWTEQGLRKVKESPSRIDSFKKSVKSAGGEVRGVWVTMGRFDTLSLVSAPDDEAMARIAMALCSLGNVKTETLRAFGEDEFKSLLGKLP